MNVRKCNIAFVYFNTLRKIMYLMGNVICTYIQTNINYCIFSCLSSILEHGSSKNDYTLHSFQVYRFSILHRYS